MTDQPTPPINGISGREAAEMLGVQEMTVHRWVQQGVLPRAVRQQRKGLDRSDVERLALERYETGCPYWVTTVEVAAILGVTRTRVKQLGNSERLPFVVFNGRRFYRRHQVEVIANAREARWH